MVTADEAHDRRAVRERTPLGESSGRRSLRAKCRQCGRERRGDDRTTLDASRWCRILLRSVTHSSSLSFANWRAPSVMRRIHNDSRRLIFEDRFARFFIVYRRETATVFAPLQISMTLPADDSHPALDRRGNSELVRL